MPKGGSSSRGSSRSYSSSSKSSKSGDKSKQKSGGGSNQKSAGGSDRGAPPKPEPRVTPTPGFTLQSSSIWPWFLGGALLGRSTATHTRTVEHHHHTIAEQTNESRCKRYEDLLRECREKNQDCAEASQAYSECVHQLEN